MFTFYKMLADQHGWQATFLKNDEVTNIKNDKQSLRDYLSNVNYLVGYDNYNIDDRLLASLLNDVDPYDTLTKIKGGKRIGFRMHNPITIDLKQELGSWDNPILLNEIKLNLGLSVDYDDLKTIQMVFKEREDYLTSKFEVVKEFKLRPDSVKKTRVNLAADVLKSVKATDKNRLNIIYDKRLARSELPKPLLDFYADIQNRFNNGVAYEELEKEQFTFKVAGLDHVYGFGGLHGVKENYVGSGHYMQIDVKSYYPTLILNNGFLSDKSITKYKDIYDKRLELQKQKDSKQEAYKLITNIVYGGLKSKWSNLYNPQMSNSIVVNGQLILTHLILVLENFCELIQSNTDGLIIKYEPVMKESILKIIKLFERHYSLTFDIDYINKIAQKDVNNYVVRYENSELHAVGRFANYDEGSFERNSMTIIDKTLVNYYMNGIRVNKTIMNEYKKGNLERFQYVVKSGKYDGMVHEYLENTLLEGTYNSKFTKLPKVNRVFAARNNQLGSVYRTKNDKETKYTKVAYTSDNCLVWNKSLSKLNKRLIDLNWYIKEVERWLF